MRRAPTALAGAVNDRQLTTALGPVTSVTGDASCFAASLDGHTVVADGADLPVLPASNQKIITAAAALEVLGPEFTFVTRAHGALNGDAVDGDLVLVGGGDPLLVSSGGQFPDGFVLDERYPTFEAATHLETLADAVAAQVRHVSGRIVADDSHFDGERYGAGWPAGVRGETAGPLSAAFVNDSRRLDAPKQWVDDPSLYTASEFTRLLRARGVVIDAEPAVGALPAGLPELAEVASAPLTVVVKEMLLNSDNNTAEMVLKEIGAKALGGPGSTAAGLAAVMDKLAEWGVPLAGVSLTDGSGLDRANLLTCRAVLAVLDHVGSSGPMYDALPTPGGPLGTLRDPGTDADLGGNLTAFEDLQVDQRVHAKTGTLSDVKALSGWFDLADGRKVAFSLIVNGAGAKTQARQLWRVMAQSLAAFSGVPSSELAIAGT